MRSPDQGLGFEPGPPASHLFTELLSQVSRSQDPNGLGPLPHPPSETHPQAMVADVLAVGGGIRGGLLTLSLATDRAQAWEGSAAPFPQMRQAQFSVNPSLLWAPSNIHPLFVFQCWVSC